MIYELERNGASYSIWSRIIRIHAWNTNKQKKRRKFHNSEKTRNLSVEMKIIRKIPQWNSRGNHLFFGELFFSVGRREKLMNFCLFFFFHFSHSWGALYWYLLLFWVDLWVFSEIKQLLDSNPILLPLIFCYLVFFFVNERNIMSGCGKVLTNGFKRSWLLVDASGHVFDTSFCYLIESWSSFNPDLQFVDGKEQADLLSPGR